MFTQGEQVRGHSVCTWKRSQFSTAFNCDHSIIALIHWPIVSRVLTVDKQNMILFSTKGLNSNLQVCTSLWPIPTQAIHH